MNCLQRMSHAWYKRRLERPELASMFDPPPVKQWVAIDCEMTGLHPKKHHLLSVAAIHINDNTIDTGNGMHLVCRPPVMPDRGTIIIHGLRTADVENGMSYDEMLALLLPFIDNRPIVGFCTQLDMAFLNPLVKRYMGTTLPNPVIDLRQLYGRRMSSHIQNLPSRSLQLNSILAQYNIPDLGAHDAYNDAIMTAMAFLHVR